MIRRRLPVVGQRLYPSPSARRTDRDCGRTPFRRCIQCGMWNDTRTTSWSNTGDGLGDGLDQSQYGIDPATYDDNTPYGGAIDHQVNGGCRFCGSLKWRKSKPVAIPDLSLKIAPASEKGLVEPEGE